MYYERMHEKVKIVMMQCDLDDDTCLRKHGNQQD